MLIQWRLDTTSYMNSPYLLSTGEAAKVLGVHEVTLWNQIASDRLPVAIAPTRVGRNWKWSKAKLEAFIGQEITLSDDSTQRVA